MQSFCKVVQGNAACFFARKVLENTRFCRLRRVCIFEKPGCRFSQISKYKYEIPVKYQNTTYSQNIKIQHILANFRKFSKFWCKSFVRFLKFWGVFCFFSGRAWKMLKNDALIVKIGVDTADILLFWTEILFWYFDDILIFSRSARLKSKSKYFDLKICTQ